MSAFRFKKFAVEHRNSSMKVGTDAVLLGAIAGVRDAERILDVGTGCGVIALALAQRTEAEIHAIDIDNDSVQEALQNFSNSLWHNRLTAQITSFQLFAEKSSPACDIVVSNPPFFQNALPSPVASRNLARHNQALSFQDFAKACKNVLKPDGEAWVIIPVSERHAFIRNMIHLGFRVFYQMHIYPKPNHPANRCILGFTSSTNDVIYEEFTLTIRNSDGSYSEGYKNITAEFYIHF